MRKWSACSLILCSMLLGCGGGGLTGKYHMEQVSPGLGAGMGQVDLELRENKTYTITAGSTEWFIGTWTVEGDFLTISSSNDSIGTKFHIWKGDLYPYAGGKEVIGWHWTK